MTAKAPSTPWFVRPHRWVAHVEALALACTASAGATAVFGSLFKGSIATGLVAGIPTLVTAGCWVGFVRLDPRYGQEGGHRGRQMAALPLAAVNGAIGGGLFSVLYRGHGVPRTFAGGVIFGATVGIVYWGPALLATLLVLGGPLRFAQRKASQGLSGEDVGAKALGGAAAAMSLLALLLQLLTHGSSGYSSYRFDSYASHAMRTWLRALDLGLGYSVAILGVVGGAIVLGFSAAKSVKRKAFVTRVEHGIESGFRVDATRRGMVLVKLRAPHEPFRTTNLPEEVFPLELLPRRRGSPRLSSLRAALDHYSGRFG